MLSLKRPNVRHSAKGARPFHIVAAQNKLARAAGTLRFDGVGQVTGQGRPWARENAPLAEPKSTAIKPPNSVRSASGFVVNGLFCNQFDKPQNRSHHLPGVIDQDATHGLGCCPHEMTSRFERLRPGQAQIRFVDLPRHYPTGTGRALSLSARPAAAFPSVCQVGSRIALFEACSAFTHVMACMLVDSLAEPYPRVLQSKSLPP